MSQQTAAQAIALFEAVDDYDAIAQVPWPIAEVANALIEKAKQETDDPVIAALQPLEQGGNDKWAAGAQIGTVRVIAKQIYSSVPG